MGEVTWKYEPTTPGFYMVMEEHGFPQPVEVCYGYPDGPLIVRQIGVRGYSLLSDPNWRRCSWERIPTSADLIRSQKAIANMSTRVDRLLNALNPFARLPINMGIPSKQVSSGEFANELVSVKMGQFESSIEFELFALAYAEYRELNKVRVTIGDF